MQTTQKEKEINPFVKPIHQTYHKRPQNNPLQICELMLHNLA